jgi:hypothetical protein
VGLISILLMWLLAAGAPQGPGVPPLDVRPSAPSERFIRPSEGLELRLNRALTSSDGRLAVVIADVDWTSLFALDGQSFTYHGGAAALPQGESQVAVYLVSAPNTWRQVAAFPIHVTTPAGFEQVRLAPTADVNDAAQNAEGHEPDANAPPRSTFQDFTSHLGFASEHVRDGVHFTTQTNVLAVSNQTLALRFAQIGNDASKFDLADYVWSVEGQHLTVTFGTTTFVAERHLAPNFLTRGIRATARFSRVDFTVAGVNGQTIVGFSNFLGVTTANNQVGVAVVGAELTHRPRAARVEMSFVGGARNTQSGFTQGQITDVLRSHGGGLRFIGSDPTQRFRLDTGYARSWSTNPNDPLLAQGLTTVEVRPKTSAADYVDAFYDLVRRNSPKTPVTITTSYRFERVDPLFSSVAAPQGVRSDLLQNTAGADVRVAQVSGRVANVWSHDNLNHVASILRTDGDLSTVNVTAPTGTFGQKPEHAIWWPVVTYGFNRSSQIGEGLPDNGGFVSPSQVPNQVNTLNTLNADWNIGRWHAGYLMNRSFQDNRQAGRETSDFSTLAQQLSLGLVTLRTMNLSFTFNRDSSKNFEVNQVSHTLRGGLNLAWQIDVRNSINATLNRTAIEDATAGPSHVVDVNVQYAYAFKFQPSRPTGPRIRIFARWTWQSSDALDVLAGIVNVRRNWTLGTGLALTLF